MRMWLKQKYNNKRNGIKLSKMFIASKLCRRSLNCACNPALDIFVYITFVNLRKSDCWPNLYITVDTIWKIDPCSKIVGRTHQSRHAFYEILYIIINKSDLKFLSPIRKQKLRKIKINMFDDYTITNNSLFTNRIQTTQWRSGRKRRTVHKPTLRIVNEDIHPLLKDLVKSPPCHCFVCGYCTQYRVVFSESRLYTFMFKCTNFITSE